MTGKPLRRLLLIEDNPGDARLLREMLLEGGLRATEVTHAESLAAGERGRTPSRPLAPR